MTTNLKLLLLIICISMTSCKSIISNPGKPLQDDSLELDHHYEIQDFSAKIYKIKITFVDHDRIIGVGKNGDIFSFYKKEIRQVKEVKILESIIVGTTAILAVIFVPI